MKQKQIKKHKPRPVSKSTESYKGAKYHLGCVNGESMYITFTPQLKADFGRTIKGVLEGNDLIVSRLQSICFKDENYLK